MSVCQLEILIGIGTLSYHPAESRERVVSGSPMIWTMLYSENVCALA